MESTNTMDGLYLVLTVFLLLLNGFFVAAEFALVKMTRSKIKIMQNEGRPFAKIAAWLFQRQNMALSAAQMGITMASLGLGWIGEPALARLIEPLFQNLGITSQAVLHGVAFAIAFTLITALHIVVGEQVPKIYAIRKPVPVFLNTSWLMKFFYILLYPFMVVLNGISNVILKWVGVTDAGGHDTPMSEEEIRASLSMAHARGELSRNEHQLLNAVFRFDDQVSRQIMLPRVEVEFLDIQKSFKDNLTYALDTKHTRFPLCDGSLDKVLGVIHIKDLLGVSAQENFDLKTIAREAMNIPENMAVSQLLQEFKKTHQHWAFVWDEHGTIVGVVTMEQVLEQIVGAVQDEFDAEEPDLVKEGAGRYLISGKMNIELLNDQLDLNLNANDSDTLSGFVIEKAGANLIPGMSIDIDQGITVEVVEVKGMRALKVRLILPEKATKN